MDKTKARLLLLAVFTARGTSFLFSKTLMNTISIMGIVIAGESLSIAKIIGYILILTALIVYNLKTETKNSSKERAT